MGALLPRQRRAAGMEVFRPGEAGFHTIRIPAIVRTTRGTLLAFAEGRKEGRGDKGAISVVVKRSSDQGRTWSALAVVWEDGANTCGNPAPVVDASTGFIWLLLTWNLGTDGEKAIMSGDSVDVRKPYVTHSEDDGETWSVPECIAATASKPHWRWYATGPCHGIQLTRGPHRGRLVIPCNHSDHSDESKHPYRSHVVYSDDAGKTWSVGGVHEDKTNESAVVELADGRVLQSMRSYHGKNTRAMAASADGGVTFGEQLYHADGITTPVCQGSILRARWPEPGAEGLLLHSNPVGPGRRCMAISASYDEGATWLVAWHAYTGGAAYSDLIDLGDGTFGVFYEKDNAEMVLQEFSVAQLEPDTKFNEAFPEGSVVTLKSHTGHYANVKNGSKEAHTSLWTDADGACPASKWVVERVGDKSIAFKSVHSDQYINVQNDGGEHTPLWTCTSRRPPASRWTPYSRPGGRWAFSSHTGHWMNVKGDGAKHVALWSAVNGECPASCWEVALSGPA